MSIFDDFGDSYSAMKRRKTLGAAPVDRLSGLPEDILNHILSLLGTDEVIKTCVLSKKLMSLWLSFPVLDFKYSPRCSELEESLDEFLNHVSRILQQRSQRPAVFLHKFRLRLFRCRRDQPDGRIDNAISFAVKNGVKELVLETMLGVYPLPDIAFGRSVKSLTLGGMDVTKLNQLLHGCPLLENLALRSGIAPQHIKISGSKIKLLNLLVSGEVKSVDIDCPHLQFLNFGGSRCYFDHFSLSTSCRHFLKILKLSCAPITDNWIENLLPGFALLETLKLTHCDQLKRIKVSNNSNLKHVWFIECRGLQDVEVRVTDLESFSFWGMPGVESNSEIKWDRICNINIIHCKHLRRLSLRGCGIPQELLREQVPRLLQLERLQLNFHSFQDRAVICHRYLKHLELSNHRRMLKTKVIMNTPRLVSFSYSAFFDTINPFVSFIYNPNLSATLTICGKPRVMPLETSFFEDLYGLIRLMDGCKVLTFRGGCKKFDFPPDLREALTSPFTRLKHMRLEVPSSQVTVEVLDSVLWLAPYLRTLSFATRIPKEKFLFIKFEYDQCTREEDSEVNPSDLAARQPYRRVDVEIHEDVEERVNLLKYFKDQVKSMRLMKRS